MGRESEAMVADTGDGEAGAALRVRGLRKRYGATEAVKGVDLTVQPGQVYGLLGPNGSGKTTTLSCALGLLAPTSGTCEVLLEMEGEGGAEWIAGLPNLYVITRYNRSYLYALAVNDLAQALAQGAP